MLFSNVNSIRLVILLLFLLLQYKIISLVLYIYVLASFIDTPLLLTVVFAQIPNLPSQFIIPPFKLLTTMSNNLQFAGKSVF